MPRYPLLSPRLRQLLNPRHRLYSQVHGVGHCTSFDPSVGALPGGLNCTVFVAGTIDDGVPAR